MKNRLLTNTRRHIFFSFPRFIALMIMSFLGVFVYAGLQATSPDMMASLDQYLDNHNHYDIKIVSTTGLESEDLDALKEVKGVKDVEGSYSKDVAFKIKGNDYVINVQSYPSKINTVDLIKGRLPEKNNEIVVEENLLDSLHLKLNQKIKLKDDSLTQTSFKIVGTVDSSLFFNNAIGTSGNRGNTSVGKGTIDFYGVVTQKAFDLDYYTSIYLTVNDACGKETGSKAYTSLIDKVVQRIEKIASKQEKLRDQSIYKTASNKIDQQETKLYKKLNDAKLKLNTTKEQLDTTKITLDSYKAELENTYAKLMLLKSQIDAGYVQYTQVYTEGLAQYNEKLSQYNASLELYNKGLETYNEGLETYNKNKEEVDHKIQDAREQLDDLEDSKWYIYDRSDYSTYSEFIDDSASIKNLSKIFPVVFYAVAVLVSLISMNRMVEDDRTEIGTLKSLGFSNNQIMIKYFIFSLLATTIGGILGVASGIIIIPNLIYSIYTILFDLPKFVLKLNLVTSVIGFVISLICVCGTTIYTVLKELKEKPSELLRPKAPKAGKRILLERINCIWSRISFSNKVTIRNIFRYKKRVLVTIIGIIGCTALVLSGFGIKDSIVDIPTKQYGEVFTYDGSSYINNMSDEEVDKLFDCSQITSYVPVKSVHASVNSTNVYLFMSKQDTSSIVNFIDEKTHSTIKLDPDKVIITDKMAELENIHEGDEITFKDVDNHEYTMEVQAIVSNYVEHYIFMDLSHYKGDTSSNVVFFNTKTLSNKQQDNLKIKLLKNKHVISVSYVQSLIDTVSNMLKSLDKVVIILVVLASLLSFVVLYNLANININERKREVATIKVLGFYNNEVDSYINKEMIILTIVGIIIGIVAGIYLTNIVVSTVEIERCRFIHQIKMTSYIYAVMISMIFTVIVSCITHFILKKIDMVESLKSVE